MKKWARRDSNPRPKDYESSALPLRHRPVTTFYSIFNGLSVSVRYLPLLGRLSIFLVGRVPQARDNFSISKVTSK